MKHKHHHRKNAKVRPFSIEPDSECASLVEYEDGTLSVTFVRGGGTYDYPVSKSEAREARRAANEGRFGEFLNEEIL